MNFFRRIWNWWKPIARKIGDFQARVMLTIFYFIFFAPFGLIVRLTMDPLAMKPHGEPHWKLKSEKKNFPTQQW